MVGLEDGAGGHGGVEYDDRFLVVVDGLDLVGPRGGEEEEVGGGAVEHSPELGGAAAIVDGKRILYGYVVAETPTWSC